MTKPLPDESFEILKESYDKGRKAPFNHITDWMIRSSWQYAKEQCGLADDKTLVRHSLRHTVASRLIESGVGTQLVKEYLGHRAIATTQRYIHLNVDSMSPIVEVLNAQKGHSLGLEKDTT